MRRIRQTRGERGGGRENVEILQRHVQAGGVLIVRAHCWPADGNSGCRVREMSQIFLIAAQRRDSRARAVPIVPVPPLL